MKAIIHIGSPKTGTTTIQHFLASNREGLRRQGIFFSTASDSNHRSRGLGNPTTRCEQWKKFRREIEANCGKDDLIILSDEALFHCSKDAIEKIKELADTLFDSVIIVLYLRRQPEFLVSFYNTRKAITSGLSISDFLSMPEERSILAYHKAIEHWSIFGKDKLKVRVFDRKEMHHNDLLTDFAHTVGFDMVGLRQTEDQNISLGSTETEFLRLFHMYITASKKNLLTKNDHRLFARTVKYLRERAKDAETGKKDTKSYYLNRNEVHRILDQSREGNDRIAREYLGREKLFSEDVSMYPEEVTPHHLTVERSVEICTHLLKFHTENQRAHPPQKGKRLLHRFKAMLTWAKQNIFDKMANGGGGGGNLGSLSGVVPTTLRLLRP